MKKFRCFILLFVLFFTLNACAPRCPSFEQNTPASLLQSNSDSSELPHSIKAMWISQFDLAPMCLEEGFPRSEASFRSHVVLMVSNLKRLGINTVFVQVRPNADSFYPSALFPASEYAVGQTDDTWHYDPFDIILTEFRAANISVHAWINPMRAMKTDSKNAQEQEFPIGAWIASDEYNGHYVVEHNGCYYLNPAEQPVRDLIVSGVREILTKYDVDGIHLDDYFYPTTSESFDRISYESYTQSGENLSLGEFRQKQTYRLIEELSACTRRYGRLFGVSPSGNTQRNLDELSADVASWCQDGLLDYLCPQIYFGMEHQTFPFEKICVEFSRLAADSKIPLIVGMTLEKAANGFGGIADAFAGSGENEWIENRDVLLRCLQYTQELDACRGVAYFSYRLFFSPQSGIQNPSTADEIAAFLPCLQEIAWE